MADPPPGGLRAGVLVGSGMAVLALGGLGLAEAFDVGLLLRPGRRAEDLVRRWGLAAVVVTRPVPVLAESTVAAAGAMGMSLPAVVGAATLGAVPEAVLYSLAGAVASTFANAAIVFAAVLVLAALVAAIGARAARAEAPGGGQAVE